MLSNQNTIKNYKFYLLLPMLNIIIQIIVYLIPVYYFP